MTRRLVADGTFTATNVPYQLYVYGAQTPPDFVGIVRFVL